MPIKPIERDRSPFWQGHGVHLGVPVRRSTRIPVDPRAKARSRALATAVCRGWEREIETRIVHGKKPDLSFGQAAERYLEQGGSPRFLIPLLDYFGDHTLCHEIDAEAVDRAARATLRPGFSAATFNRQILTPTRAVLRAAGRAPTLTARRVGRTMRRWLTPEEAADLIDAVAAPGTGRSAAMRLRASAILEFLLGTGTRPGEMAALRQPQLYLATAEAQILPHAGSGKTETAERLVCYPARATRALRAYLADRGTLGGHVFDNGRQGRRRAALVAAEGHSGIRDMIRRGVLRAGLNPDGITPYTLRRTWATWHHAQHRDLPLLMQRGGWASVSMAMHYTKPAPSDLAERCHARGFTLEPAHHAHTAATAGRKTQ